MNSNEYPNIDFTDFALDLDLSRRDLIKALGGGIVIFFCLGDRSILEAQQRSLPSDFNAFLRIGADGRVTCYTGKIEMGQGNLTGLAQMLAEEVDVSLESVDMVMGDTLLCPWDGGTWGSTSTRGFGPPLRAAGAEARSVLLELAAERLRVPQDRLVAQDGVIFDRQQQDKRVTYGELAQGKTIARWAKVKPALKSPSEFKVINKPALRREAVEKVTGKALYAGDIRLPGMLYARILRPPAHGARLKNVDTSAAERIEGVTVVREGDFVAVLHPSPDQADEALGKIVAEFDPSPSQLDDRTIFDHLVMNGGAGRIVAQAGSLGPGRMPPAVVVEQTYLDGYKAHAAMETHTALAQVEGNKATVWVGTQTPFPAKDEIVAALGFAESNVRVITPFVGGGFGGKGSVNTQAVEAARLSRATGKPVQVCWSREEEFFFDAFRPAAVVKIKAGLTKDGKPMSWDYSVYAAGDRGAAHFYDIPNHRTTVFDGAAHPFATGPWRAPGNSTNCFARESHIDLMAAQAKMDPIEFRLKNLKDQRAIRVLEAAAEKFGWHARPRAERPGTGRGARHGCRHLGRRDRRGPGRSADGTRPGQTGGLRPGHGPGGQSPGRHAPGGRLHHDGPGLHPLRGYPLPQRHDPRPQLRHLRAAPLPRRAEDRDRPARPEGPAHEWRRRAGDHHRRGRRRQRHLRRHRRPAAPVAHDPGAGPQGYCRNCVTRSGVDSSNRVRRVAASRPEGLGDGPAHGKLAIAKLRGLRLTLPPHHVLRLCVCPANSLCTTVLDDGTMYPLKLDFSTAFCTGVN